MLPPDLYKRIKNIPITGSSLVNELARYRGNRQYLAGANKLFSLERSGEIIRLKRGLYVLDASEFGFPPSGPIASNHIYGPSYLSSQWALSFYGLIPERVTIYTASTLKHTRTFENKLGLFVYRQLPQAYFSIGIVPSQMDGATFLMASPEKALLDLILSVEHVPANSMAALLRYFDEDIRLDISELKHLDLDILSRCAAVSPKKSTIHTLIKLIQKL